MGARGVIGKDTYTPGSPPPPSPNIEILINIFPTHPPDHPPALGYRGVASKSTLAGLKGRLGESPHAPG